MSARQRPAPGVLWGASLFTVAPFQFESRSARLHRFSVHCNQMGRSDEMQGLQPAAAAACRSALELMAGRLRAYFRRRMPTLPTEVGDLVQETRLAVHLQRGTCDPSFAVSAWFTAMARHKLVDQWRRRRAAGRPDRRV